MVRLRTCPACMYENVLSYENVSGYIIIFQQWNTWPAKEETVEIEVEVIKWLGLHTVLNHSWLPVLCESSQFVAF